MRQTHVHTYKETHSCRGRGMNRDQQMDRDGETQIGGESPRNRSADMKDETKEDSETQRHSGIENWKWTFKDL